MGGGPSRRLRVLQALTLILGVVALLVSSRLRLSGDLPDRFPHGP